MTDNINSVAVYEITVVMNKILSNFNDDITQNKSLHVSVTMKSLLKVFKTAKGNKYTNAININWEYLKIHRFGRGDCVRVIYH